MNKCLWIVIAIALLASCTSEEAALRSSEQFGCKITRERAEQLTGTLCLQESNGPATVGGVPQDTREEQNVRATQDVSVPITMPNGDVAAEVLCEINMQQHSVVYTRVTRGPTSKAEADYLRTLGACENWPVPR
ncbi:MAG TPA: hypothetical protein VIX59_02960 [Candidatus Binataceae bacterium]